MPQRVRLPSCSFSGSSVHSTCVVDFMRIATRTERQGETENTVRLKHDWSNTMFCYSVYCVANDVLTKKLKAKNKTTYECAQ